MYTKKITDSLSAALRSHGIADAAVLSRSNPKTDADFQCNDIMRQSKTLNTKKVAAEVVSSLQLTGIARVESSGPGFLNIWLDDSYVAESADALAERSSVIDETKRPLTVILDYGGPNIAKPLHVGHLRSFVIGESMRRINAALGHKVISDMHFGDWGLQIGKLLLGFERSGGDFSAPPPHVTLSALGEYYRAGQRLAESSESDLARARQMTLAVQSGDAILRLFWQRFRDASLEAILPQASDLDARFDFLFGESDADPYIPSMIERLVSAGLASESEGALVVPVGTDIPPVLLRKSDGAALYATTDLATIVQRIDLFSPDRIVYFTDDRQDIHMKGCFRVAEASARAGVVGFVPLPELVHACFGTVKDKSGSPYKTRDGSPALLETLIEEAVARASSRMGSDADPSIVRSVAMAAVKFADLSTDRRSGYVFDVEAMTSPTGRTGPYVQYAHARLSSLLSKAGEKVDLTVPIQIASPLDREVAMACLRFSAYVEEASATNQPKEICDGVYAVASAVSRLWAAEDILHSAPDILAPRLKLLYLARRVIETGLTLLGITAPTRM